MSLPSRPPDPIRTLVVDDERVARRGLALMLSSDHELEVSECPSGEDAVRMLTAHPYELVFLDVQMRGLDGFGVIDAVGPRRMPVIVFTTAYAEHALRAFEASAVDYVTKPISEERLAAAVARAKEIVRLRRLGQASQQLIALLAAQHAAPGDRPASSYRFEVRSGRSTYSIDADAIDWVESADNYARLWSNGRSHLVRESMQTIERRLAPMGFIRVHRTAIVNVQHVRAVRLEVPAGYAVVMSNGHRLPLSRERRAAVLDALRLRDIAP